MLTNFQTSKHLMIAFNQEWYRWEKTCINASGRQSKILETCYEDRVGERAKMQRERACLAEDMPRIYYSSSEISTDGISPR